MVAGGGARVEAVEKGKPKQLVAPCKDALAFSSRANERPPTDPIRHLSRSPTRRVVRIKGIGLRMIAYSIHTTKDLPLYQILVRWYSS